MFTVRRKRVKLLRRRLQAEKARNRTKSQRTSCDIVRTGTHAQSPLQTSNAISAVTGPEGRDEHIVDRCGPLTDSWPWYHVCLLPKVSVRAVHHTVKVRERLSHNETHKNTGPRAGQE